MQIHASCETTLKKKKTVYCNSRVRRASLKLGFSVCFANSITTSCRRLISTDLFFCFLLPQMVPVIRVSRVRSEKTISLVGTRTAKLCEGEHDTTQWSLLKKPQGEDLSTTILLLLPFLSFLFGSEFNKNTYEIRASHVNISKNLEGFGVILYLTELLLDHFHSPGFLVLDLNRLKKKKKKRVLWVRWVLNLRL